MVVIRHTVVMLLNMSIFNNQKFVQTRLPTSCNEIITLKHFDYTGIETLSLFQNFIGQTVQLNCPCKNTNCNPAVPTESSGIDVVSISQVEMALLNGTSNSCYVWR